MSFYAQLPPARTAAIARWINCLGHSITQVRNEEVTLKRIEQKRGEVVLHPANVSMEAMRYSRITLRNVSSSA